MIKEDSLKKKKKTEERIQCVKVRAATAVCPSLPDFPKLGLRVEDEAVTLMWFQMHVEEVRLLL